MKHFLLVFALTCNGAVVVGQLVGEYKMLSEKLKGYPTALRNGNGRPVKSYQDKFELSMELQPIHMADLDEAHQTISIQAALKLRWKDPYLAWKNDYNGAYDYINVVAIDYGQAWTPRVLHSNNKNDPQIVKRFGEQSHVFVDSEGRVTWQPTGVYTSTCELNLLDFPFDNRQECRMIFEPSTEVVSYSNLTTNDTRQAASDWTAITIAEVSMETIPTQEFTYAGSTWSLVDYTCAQSGNKAVYTFFLRRNFQYTLYNTMIPCAILSLLQLSTFGIRADAPDRTAFSLTVLLSFVICQATIKQDVPKTSNLVHLLLYAIVQLGIGMIITVHSAVLCYLTTHSKIGQPQRTLEKDVRDLPDKYALADRLVFLFLFVATLGLHIVICAIITT